MDTKYIHTDQLLNAKKAIEPNLYPLKTHVAYTLFGKKDNLSPVIATVEAKARMLITHYGLSAEDVVDRVSKFLLMPLVKYVEGQRTIKSFLLHSINHIMDRMMSDLRRKETFHVPKAVREFREKELNSEFIGTEPVSEHKDEDIEIFDGIKTKKPSMKPEQVPTVIIRRKKSEPEIRTYLDFYDDEF